MAQTLKVDPLITVIVATKNSEGTLQRCIDSFTSQTWQRKELIIVDGGSCDGTVQILKANNEKIDHWNSKPDRGIAHAWNKALKFANGEWILFLGSDDCFTNLMVLEEFSKKIKDPSIKDRRIVYGMVQRFFLEDGRLDTQGMEWYSARQVFFSEKMMIPHQSCFHHFSVFQEFGSFDESYSIVADYEFLLRILKEEEAGFLPGFITTNMAFGGISSRVSTLLIMQKECDRALKNNGFKPKGYKRAGNIMIYKLLGLVIKYCGERVAARILDSVRFIFGKKPIWTRN